MKSGGVDKLNLAWAYIELLITENSRLHQTIGKVDRLCGDILADCSREVYEANNLEQLDFDPELDAAILGDGCFKVTRAARETRVRVAAPTEGRLPLCAQCLEIEKKTQAMLDRLGYDWKR